MGGGYRNLTGSLPLQLIDESDEKSSECVWLCLCG